jgi:hypothetical protein
MAFKVPTGPTPGSQSPKGVVRPASPPATFTNLPGLSGAKGRTGGGIWAKKRK